MRKAGFREFFLVRLVEKAPKLVNGISDEGSLIKAILLDSAV